MKDDFGKNRIKYQKGNNLNRTWSANPHYFEREKGSYQILGENVKNNQGIRWNPVCFEKKIPATAAIPEDTSGVPD